MFLDVSNFVLNNFRFLQPPGNIIYIVNINMYCAGYGQTGPYSRSGCFDTAVQALSGLADFQARQCHAKID
eukprot:COSAG06_NODE_1167_length_10451_cov_16.691654_6_plen_71_part_00